MAEQQDRQEASFAETGAPEPGNESQRLPPGREVKRKDGGAGMGGCGVGTRGQNQSSSCQSSPQLVPADIVLWSKAFFSEIVLLKKSDSRKYGHVICGGNSIRLIVWVCGTVKCIFSLAVS